MREKWEAMETGKKQVLLLLPVAILLLILSLSFALQKGIGYKGGFLPQKEENLWRGSVDGLKTTVRWSETASNPSLEITCGESTTVYSMTGDVDALVLYRDREELFRGSYRDSFLWDEAGEPQWGEVTVSYGDGMRYYIDSDGNERVDTPLRLPAQLAVKLLLRQGETTRGEPPILLAAVLVLVVLCVELWFPELRYHLDIGRWTNGSPEPSDLYYSSRMIGAIILVVCFLVLLVMPFMGN